MPRNGAGTYTAPANSWNPASGVIDSSDWNDTRDDLEAAISDSIARDGQTTTTQPIPFTQGVRLNQGSAGSPAVSQIADTNTGLFFPAADTAAIGAGGATVATFKPAGIAIASGSAASPAVSVVGDANTGLFSPGADIYAIGAGGYEGLRVAKGGASAAAVLIQAGSSARPSLAVVGDANTGLFFPSADIVALGAGGYEGARIAKGSGSAAALLLPAGSSARPSLAAIGDANTGLFFPAADAVAIGAGGYAGIKAHASGSAATVSLMGGNGVVVGSATGGAKGAGTLNATEIYRNGAVLPFTKYFESDPLPWTNGSEVISVAHDLGETPKGFLIFLRCNTADLPYEIGEIVFPYNVDTSTGNQHGTLSATSTDLYWSHRSAVTFSNRSSPSSSFSPDTGKWDVLLRAWA